MQRRRAARSEGSNPFPSTVGQWIVASATLWATWISVLRQALHRRLQRREEAGVQRLASWIYGCVQALHGRLPLVLEGRQRWGEVVLRMGCWLHALRQRHFTSGHLRTRRCC